MAPSHVPGTVLSPYLRIFLGWHRASWTTRLAILRLGVVMAAIEIALRALPLDRVARLAGATLRDAGREGSDLRPPASKPWPESAQSTAAMVVLRNWPFGNTCLRESLLFAHLLRDRRPILRIGVARAGADFHAHAWLEVAGVPRGTGHADFTPMQAQGAPLLSPGKKRPGS